MSQVLTRAMMRDAVRRKLGITPPVDPQPSTGLPVPGAKVGDLPVDRLDPSNEFLNDAAAFTISEINAECGFHVNLAISIPVAASASTTTGPAYIDLSNVGGQKQSVNDIRRVVWEDNTITTVLLPNSYLRLDRDRRNTDLLTPGTPIRYVLEAYQIILIPAPVIAGTLNIYAGTGLVAPVSDIDIVDQLPADLYEVILDGMIARVARRTAGDPEMQALLAVHEPLFRQVGIPRIKRWKAELNRSFQGAMRVEKKSRANATYKVRR